MAINIAILQILCNFYTMFQGNWLLIGAFHLRHMSI